MKKLIIILMIISTANLFSAVIPNPGVEKLCSASCGINISPSNNLPENETVTITGTVMLKGDVWV
ncbi:MAG: hypothetical protein ACHQFW_12050, partial [Chitinophagales bacterium]